MFGDKPHSKPKTKKGNVMLTFLPIEARMEGMVKMTVPLARVRVPGGWLVAVVSGTINSHTAVCFVPDPEHRWDGSSLPTAVK
jgi:hypothetical protein